MTAQGRVFAYARVSTLGQTVAGQLQEIAAAGFQPPEYRVVSETISGSVPAMQRPEFARLVDRLEPGDILVVSKLDRLGRDAIDVTETVSTLSKIPVRVHCLALGGSDLTSSSGQLTMNVLTAVAQFERDLLRERTHAGLQAAKAKGKRLGRPRALSAKAEEDARAALEAGESVSKIAKRLAVSRATITRLRDSGASRADNA
ncbi:recombinase family protein [Salipiger pacificus]|nr:recombinase family protein [Alloyangia pacifica]